jgi:hypothetical protein
MPERPQEPPPLDEEEVEEEDEEIADLYEELTDMFEDRRAFFEYEESFAEVLAIDDVAPLPCYYADSAFLLGCVLYRRMVNALARPHREGLLAGQRVRACVAFQVSLQELLGDPQVFVRIFGASYVFDIEEKLENFAEAVSHIKDGWLFQKGWDEARRGGRLEAVVDPDPDELRATEELIDRWCEHHPDSTFGSNRYLWHLWNRAEFLFRRRPFGTSDEALAAYQALLRIPREWLEREEMSRHGHPTNDDDAS